MQDMLADLRESQPIAALKTTKPLQTAGTTERAKAPSILTAKASRGSGGIDTSKFSRSASDNELAGRESTTVTSEIEEMVVASAPEQDSRGRSEEDIKRILRANYNAIYTAYQRELRRNPLLKGKVLFHIVIEPDGSVSECSIMDSELNHPKLERKLALRIKRINFGAEDVETTTIDFPIAFLPG
ncbi:MAG TPA: AgmX/PglI C-terminal domain-containing protein [Candidatus Tenderia electrophaga]|uniref:AgmX/PglI C-terminal domain-containing protein n=1 Tax=Candidatus Tenderia electrophaga TaxID=1748243 RepID=A0A832N6Z7_9GAMM|nr:AgmX/PglI C-terminal domain-containing protein [Candidatus Tenderia electrophaga]